MNLHKAVVQFGVVCNKAGFDSFEFKEFLFEGLKIPIYHPVFLTLSKEIKEKWLIMFCRKMFSGEHSLLDKIFQYDVI